MKNENDISVIISSYNYGEYISLTLRLLREQKEQPSEVIVVDDCSTDHSREVLALHSSEWPELKVILNERNLGCAASVNQACAMAKGRYVACLGMDDPLFNPDFIGVAAAQTRLHPNAGFYFGEGVMRYSYPQAEFTSPIAVNFDSAPRYYSPNQFAGLYEARDNLSIPTVPSLWPREEFLRIGGLMEKMSWLADWFAALVLGFRFGVCYLPGAYQLIRYNPRSLSVTGQHASDEYRALIRTLLDTLEEEQFADVRHGFMIPAVMARHGFKLLDLCIREERYSKYLSLGLIRSVSLSEIGEFTYNVQRFGKNPPIGVLREIGRLFLQHYAAMLQKSALHSFQYGNYALALRAMRKAMDAKPDDVAFATQLAEIEERSARYSRPEDRP